MHGTHIARDTLDNINTNRSAHNTGVTSMTPASNFARVATQMVLQLREHRMNVSMLVAIKAHWPVTEHSLMIWVQEKAMSRIPKETRLQLLPSFMLPEIAPNMPHALG